MIKIRVPFFTVVLLCTMLFFLICALLFEYDALLNQHYQLALVKQEYRQHMWRMKQLRDVYVITAQRLQYLESLTDLVKDKPLKYESDACSFSNAMSFDSVLLGSDVSMCDDFVPLNRDIEYLKQSTHEYLKKYSRDLLLHSCSHDIWRDYTQSVLSPEKKGPVQNKSSKKMIKAPVKSMARTPKKGAKSFTREAIFSWPIDRSCFWLSSAFGKRKVKGVSRFHHGIDMAALKGTPVKAAASGIVIEARNARGYGNTIVIQHNKKYKTRYAHLDRIRVKNGQKVQRGQRIGDVGDTGFVHTSGIDASHLHFEVSVFGERVNPQYYLV